MQEPGFVAMRMLAALALLGGVVGCSGVDYDLLSGPRDWKAHPAVIELDAPALFYAISDIHGGYDRMVALLASSGIVAPAPASPGELRWTGGPAVLVVAGDLIDKGAQSLEVIEGLMALEKSAEAAGGKVVVTLGNHEAFFFVDPWSHRADSRYGSFEDELEDHGLTSLNIASGADPRGRWLRDRPFVARVGSWLFCHAGQTQGHTLPELESMIETAVDANGYDDPNLLDADVGLLEAKQWYEVDDAIGARYAHAAGAEHIVFGHDPTDNLSAPGVMGVAQSGALMRIDCGMSPRVDYSHGRILRIARSSSEETASEVDETATAATLWQGAIAK